MVWPVEAWVRCSKFSSVSSMIPEASLERDEVAFTEEKMERMSVKM